MNEATVAASFPAAFLEFAISRGVGRRELLDRAGVGAGELASPDNRIPLATYVTLLKAGVQLSGEPALALHFGECVPAHEITIVASLVSNAGTVRGGSHEMKRYGALMIDDGEHGTGDDIEMISGNGFVALVFRSRAYTEPLIVESAFARAVTGARSLFGGQSGATAFPKALRFTHPEPAYRAEYDRIFGVPLEFSAEVNAIVADQSIMSMMLPRANQAAVPVLREHADRMLDRLEKARSTRAAVERELHQRVHGGDARMSAVARALNLSRATLFRRLKAEGVTFESVLDDLRQKLAVRYLDEENLTVSQTSAKLGFSEAAAFSRAFKRWTGQNPREFQRS